VNNLQFALMKRIPVTNLVKKFFYKNVTYYQRFAVWFSHGNELISNYCQCTVTACMTMPLMSLPQMYSNWN